VDDRSPETRRRGRVNAPAFAFIAGILLMAVIIIGIAFLAASVT